MRFLLTFFLLTSILFADEIAITITPTTPAKLRAIVERQIEALKKNHRVKVIPFSQATKERFNTLIVAGEEVEGIYRFKAKRLILDFCNSCNHIPPRLLRETKLLVCSNSPLLWFGYGKLYSLKRFTLSSIKQAIEESYKPYEGEIRYYFGYIEVCYYRNGKEKCERFR